VHGCAIRQGDDIVDRIVGCVDLPLVATGVGEGGTLRGRAVAHELEAVAGVGAIANCSSWIATLSPAIAVLTVITPMAGERARNARTVQAAQCRWSPVCRKQCFGVSSCPCICLETEPEIHLDASSAAGP
jgi:hypothetical protein